MKHWLRAVMRSSSCCATKAAQTHSGPDDSSSEVVNRGYPSVAPRRLLEVITPIRVRSLSLPSDPSIDPAGSAACVSRPQPVPGTMLACSIASPTTLPPREELGTMDPRRGRDRPLLGARCHVCGYRPSGTTVRPGGAP